MTLLAAHQPDFLPYSGFFYKMWKADLFDLAVWDSYSHSSYHRRCLLDGDWLSLHVHRKSNQGVPFNKATYRWRESRDRVAVGLTEHLTGLTYRHRVIEMVFAVFDRQIVSDDGTASLVELNSGLILEIRDWLGIETPVVTARPLTRPKDEGIIELMEFYGATSYLSGVGGKAYLRESLFVENGYGIDWSKHQMTTGSSIVMTLALTSEPMEIVTREAEDGSAV